MRKVVTLIAFSCLSPRLGVAQQVQVPLTVESPATVSAIQTPAPSPGLEDFVREALQENPAVQSALHTVEAQRRRVPQAKALPDPTVGIGWAGNITPFSVQSGDPSSYRAVSASQQLLYPGKLKLRGEIASKEADVASSDYDAIRRRVTADVKAAFYEYWFYDKGDPDYSEGRGSANQAVANRRSPLSGWQRRSAGRSQITSRDFIAAAAADRTATATKYFAGAPEHALSA